MSNHLANALSPYLRQHAENPVDWYPWGPEALEKARREDKPIFLSIGYAACHWCHVMAHESFEDSKIAELMNASFVSIKVDREERPDLDSLYMSAVTALTGQGGWPMSVFLTPELKPFYGGTYFPAKASHGLPAFSELLQAIAKAWKEQREEILNDSTRITESIFSQNGEARQKDHFNSAILHTAASTLIQSYDWWNGGWGKAPKFPQPMLIEFLLRRSIGGERQALAPALHALHAMCRGGMYDVIGGGFARYSTDASWRVPHFEKMLYDNAQLAGVYLHAWQITREPSFRSVVESTLGFVRRELTSAQGGFCSSLDADSEGEEGRFYTWKLQEIEDTLGENAGFFKAAYGIREEGNWEGRTVLQQKMDDGTLATQFDLSERQAAEKLDDCQQLLLAAREKRVRPATDDKVLTSWNGLMLAVFAEASAAFDDGSLLDSARRNADFLLTELRPQGTLRHAWRNGRAGREVFLEDYAALILGLLALYQADFDLHWYEQAEGLARQMLERFGDPQGGFFDTPADAETVLVRPKDLLDNATPSGNSLAARSLLVLAAFSGNDTFRRIGEESLNQASKIASQYPSACGAWLTTADFALAQVKQAAILGGPGDRDTQALLRLVRNEYRPNLVLAASSFPPDPQAPEILKDRPLIAGGATAYVCENFVCKLPVTGAEQLAQQL